MADAFIGRIALFSSHATRRGTFEVGFDHVLGGRESVDARVMARLRLDGRSEEFMRHWWPPSLAA
jgi:hypothetical protein